ncbi:MAG: SDR family oxidoreductase [Gemmatimonadaceae bacterium]|nr:SDR family oxidoreductase [Gemmatimonadaceae bacterium]
MSGKRLTGCNVVITGGSRGIGAVTAGRLVAEGARVLSLSRKAGEKQAGMDHVQCDVTKASSVAHAAANVVTMFAGAPDIVINNAGIFQMASVAETKTEMFADVVGTNLFGPFHVINAFLAGMLKRGKGHVISIGSIADQLAFAENGAYSAAKFGVRGLHQVLRAELKGTGVRSTLISPGNVDTSMWDAHLESAEAAAKFPARDAMLRPDNIADAILFVLTLPPSANVDEIRITPA